VNRASRRIGYIFLCILPFLALGVVGVRALRIPGVQQGIGAVLFSVVVVAAWILGARAIVSGTAGQRPLALAGALLVLPWAIISLLWVGLGPPFQATLPENHMRYLVLLANAAIVATAYVALKDVLHDAGERFYSLIGLAAALLAGATYLVSISLSVAGTIAEVKAKEDAALVLLGSLYSVLEFFACVSTYIATAAFAASLGKAGWLGRGAVRAYVTASMVLVVLLVMRGVTFPELSSNTAPWYVRPGFIAGIPAIPWVMSCLLGVVLLRRAGDESV
jgi:hypothetical protein